MSISLPFKGVRIQFPFGLISENNKYQVCIGEHRTEVLPFKASLSSCIEDIQANIKLIIMNNPKYLELLPYTTDDNVSTSTVHIVNNDEFVISFVQLWCEYWHINIHDLSNIAKLSLRKPDLFIGPIKQPTISFVNTSNSTYNMLFNNGNTNISYVSSGTPNATTPYYFPNNCDALDIIIDTNVEIKFISMAPFNMDVNDNVIEPERDSFNVRNINADYQYILTLNADMYNVSYVIKDLLKLPYEKFLYFKKQFSNMMEIFKEQAHLYEPATLANIERMKFSLIQCTMDSHYYNRIASMMPILLKNMYMSIPDHLNDFPFDEFCYIPELSTKPKTGLQWALCNYISKKRNVELCASLLYENKSRSIRIKENTKVLLPYLNVTDKLIEDYVIYSNIGKPSNPSYEWYEDKLTGLFKLIEDGKKIYSMYPDAMEIEGIGILKMSPIRGSILRQLQNSIYNHRAEVKISLEQKLAVLLANDTNKDTLAEPVHKLSDALEAYRITKKSHLIHLGKILGHCIGTKTDSPNMFFRKDTVCAQVNEYTLEITTCLDAKNKNTDLATAFRTELQELFYLLKKELILPSILELRGLTEELLDTDGHLKEIVEAEFKQKYPAKLSSTLQGDLARIHGVDFNEEINNIRQPNANANPLQLLNEEVQNEIDREVLGNFAGQVNNDRNNDEYRTRYLTQRPNIGHVIGGNSIARLNNYNGNDVLDANYGVLTRGNIGMQ